MPYEHFPLEAATTYMVCLGDLNKFLSITRGLNTNYVSNRAQILLSLSRVVSVIPASLDRRVSSSKFYIEAAPVDEAMDSLNLHLSTRDPGSDAAGHKNTNLAYEQAILALSKAISNLRKIIKDSTVYDRREYESRFDLVWIDSHVDNRRSARSSRAAVVGRQSLAPSRASSRNRSGMPPTNDAMIDVLINDRDLMSQLLARLASMRPRTASAANQAVDSDTERVDDNADVEETGDVIPFRN